MTEMELVEGRMNMNYYSALSDAIRIRDLADRSSCHRCQAVAYRLVGKFHWTNGDYALALKSLEIARRLAEAVGDTKTAAAALDMIGNTFYYQAYYDSAASYFILSLKVYEQEGDLQGMITVLHNLSLMYHRKGDFKTTIEYLFREEQLKDKLPGSVHEIEALGAMGNLIIDSIYYRDEIADELRELKTFQSKNDQTSVYRVYRNIGKAYRQLENYRQSARYFVKASIVMERLGLVPDWDLAGADYRQADMEDSSFFYHYKSKLNFPRMSQSGMVNTLEMLGNSHRYFKHPDSAILYYDSALRINYRLNNRITFTGIHRYLVDVYKQLNDFQQAEHHLQVGLNLAKDIALIHQKNFYLEGKLLYEKKGDYRNALFYSEKYRVLQDSINRAETAINLTKMQAEFKTAKKVREVEELSQMNMLHEANLKTRNLQVALAVLMVIVVSGFGINFYARDRRKAKTNFVLAQQKDLIEQQNETLQQQNKANEVLLAEIHHRVKNNLQIISSLINLKSQQASPEAGDVLRQLNGRIYSMGLIHDKLYKKENMQLIRLDLYLVELGKHLLDSFDLKDYPVSLVFDCEKVEMEVEQALTCGLIYNELFTNSLKYAFASDQVDRIVKLELKTMGRKMALHVEDNGRKIHQLPGHLQKSFGLRFVDQLVTTKLAGVWSYKMENGFKTSIQMPIGNGQD